MVKIKICREMGWTEEMFDNQSHEFIESIMMALEAEALANKSVMDKLNQK